MDVTELLSYKPEVRAKRAGRNEDDRTTHSTKKSRRSNDSESSTLRPTQNKSDGNGIPDDIREDILKLVEAEPEVEQLNESSLKKLLLNFEKKSLRNQEFRLKFPDNPEKFMESEVELHEAIQELHVVATQPDLYRILVELNAVQSLLGLITHENTDISIGVIDLLQELTDVDTLNESDEDTAVLIDALLDGQIITVLVQNAERLDELVKEESDGVHNSMAIVENIIEFKPEVCAEAAKQGLITWILKRLKAKLPFDGNKLYASELLSILLQNTEENRQYLGEIDGIDVLLQQLAHFKRHDPQSAEEQEMMENMFDCLCSCLMFNPNRAKFLKGEGLQLMNLMLREKKVSRNGALKVLNYAMANAEGADNCTKFVDVLGLRTVFPLFMKTSSKHKKKGLSNDEHEEHVCSIITSLLKNCKGLQRQRLVAKFTENDHEKVDRLMELHFKYLDKIVDLDAQIEKEKTILEKRAPLTADQEDDFYLRRLDGGLFTLQLVDYIMLEVCSTGAPTVKQRVMKILNLKGGSIKMIRNIMREYAGNIGDDKTDADYRELEQQRILQLVDKF